MKKKRSPNRPITPELLQQMQELRNQGLYYKEIGQRLNLNKGTVCATLKQAAEAPGEKAMAEAGELAEFANARGYFNPDACGDWLTRARTFKDRWEPKPAAVKVYHMQGMGRY
jgi:hypothetical protein